MLPIILIAHVLLVLLVAKRLTAHPSALHARVDWAALNMVVVGAGIGSVIFKLGIDVTGSPDGFVEEVAVLEGGAA